MIEQDIIFMEIQSLSGAITASLRGDAIHMSRDEVNKVGAIYKRITNGRRLNLSCADCVKNALQYLQVWYEREYPFHQATKTNGHVEAQVEATNKKKKK